MGAVLEERCSGNDLYFSISSLLIIVGITGYTTKEHICRAILESIAFQTRAVLEAMLKDSGHKLKQLNVEPFSTCY